MHRFLGIDSAKRFKNIRIFDEYLNSVKFNIVVEGIWAGVIVTDIAALLTRSGNVAKV